MQIFGGYFFNICIFSEVILIRNAYFRRFMDGEKTGLSKKHTGEKFFATTRAYNNVQPRRGEKFFAR